MESIRQRPILHAIPLTTLVLQLFIMITNIYCSSVDSNSDLHALLSFKSGITKDPFGVLSSWDALSRNSTTNGAPTFCRWIGVTCSRHASPGRVTSLRLRGRGLTGIISPGLGNLTRLRALDLSANKLGGEIPSSLVNCRALYELNLSTNSLSGAIPPAMGRFPKLALLDLHKNGISSLIPSSFANLTTLTVFTISVNYIHGQIPPWLGNFTGLTYLDMAVNMMVGHIPPLLSKLDYLEYLDVEGNMIEGVINPSLFNMSSLRFFNVGSNRLSGSLPPNMGFTLPNLRWFSVFYNNFGGQIPASLSNITLLEWIVLHGNMFQGRIPPNIGMNGKLTIFEVGQNELQATEPKDWDFLISFANCSNLMSINLNLNNLSGVLPNTITNLSRELQDLGLGGNQLSGKIPTGIGEYCKMTSLKLASNLFIGSIPSDIGNLWNLKELMLFENRLTGEIPSSLGNITGLNLLLLFTNSLSGTIPITLGNLGKLTLIDISGNRLSGQIPQEIVSISSLTTLFNLSHNALSGSIPPQIGSLVNLGTIDLSSNNLSGEIPTTLGSCLEVQLLYLQQNFLQGQIPEDLNTLRGLEVLDLSDNNLSGSIPDFLASFHFMWSLNLSFNHLSGLVPDKGIFSNASGVSIERNGALCGGSLFLHLPACPAQAADNNSSRNRHLEILIFSVIGIFGLAVICTVTFFYLKKKLRSKPGDSNRDQSSLLLNVMHQRISYAELCLATDGFSEQNLIGHGSFSAVYRGSLVCGVNSIDIAVKVLDLQQVGASRCFMSECDALKRIQHRKLVKVITVCDSTNHSGDEFKAIVLEFISNGSLHKWLHQHESGTGMLTLLQRLNIALDVAEALEYLHHGINPYIVHCDIKPSNILLDDDMIAHVGDFGLAKIMNVKASSDSTTSSLGIKGTVGYLAPEFGMGTEISTNGDIFSYGVLLLEILTGKQPTDALFDYASLPKFVEAADHDQLLEIIDGSMPYNGNTNDLIDLYIAPISRLGLICCRDSPRQRMNMSEVVKELYGIKDACERKFCSVTNP